MSGTARHIGYHILPRLEGEADGRHHHGALYVASLVAEERANHITARHGREAHFLIAAHLHPRHGIATVGRVALRQTVFARQQLVSVSHCAVGGHEGVHLDGGHVLGCGWHLRVGAPA